MKNFFTASISSLIGFLILIFIVFPLSFGALARHYIHTGLKSWVKNHPGSTYQFKVLDKNIFSSTQQIQLSFDGISILDTPFKLAYGPLIFDDGIHLGLARIVKATTQINGIPPTTYFGKINFLGGITLDTHTPNPTALINLFRLFSHSDLSFALDSIDTETYSSLQNRSLDFKISLNQLNISNPPYSLKVNKIYLTLNDLKEIHRDPTAMASFNAQGISYEDGFNHLAIPYFTLSHYEVVGSRFATFNTLQGKINQPNNNPDEKSEFERQAIEAILLGVNHRTEFKTILTLQTPESSAAFNLELSFPGLADSPTPNEIIKHIEYQAAFAVPAFHWPATQKNPIEITLQKLSMTEDKARTEFHLPLLSFKENGKTLFLLKEFSLKSEISNPFLSKHQGEVLDAQTKQLCFMEQCMTDVNLSNEIKGLDKNALLDRQGDLLVEVIGTLAFGTAPNEVQVLPLKSLLTSSSENVLNIHGQLPHGSASLDFDIKTPHLSSQKPLSQNILVSGVLKLPSQDISTWLKAADSQASNSPYEIKDTSDLSFLDLFSFIHQTWLNAGFIRQEGPSEVLTLNFSPEEGLRFNKTSFNELHRAALYANFGDFDAAQGLLNKPEYQDNPAAQKMKAQIAEIQKSLTEKEVISNLPASNEGTPTPIPSGADD